MSCNINVHNISYGQTYVFIYLYTMSMPVTIMALSLLRHTGKLKKSYHLIVAKCACVNEFVNGIVHLAHVLENMVQNVCREPTDPSSPVPLMTSSQSQGKCIVKNLQLTRYTSSLPWIVWLWCIWIQGMGWQSLPSHNYHPYVMHFPICFCVPSMVPPYYDELPWKTVWWGEHLDLMRHEKTSSNERFVPIFTSHTFRRFGQSSTHFFLVPFTQWLMSFAQNQIFVDTWLLEQNYFFKPL